MAEIFIPFAQYNQDLVRSMTGLCQVYPSKLVTVKLTEDNPDRAEELVKELVADADKYTLEIINNSKSATDIDYGAIRSKLYKNIYRAVEVHGDEPDVNKNDSRLPSLGDINFLSNEVLNGQICHDIIALVPAEQGKKSIILQDDSLANRTDRTGFAFSVELDEYEQMGSTRTYFSFNAIIMYYTLHMIDPLSKTADTAPVVVDMPMGIYLPGTTISMQVNSGETYSARIHSRIATSDAVTLASDTTSNPAIDKTPNEEAVRESKLLGQFADLANKMDEIITRNGEHLGYTWADIKSALEYLKNQSAVNVPYIKDDTWYLNGRKLGTALERADGIGAEINSIKKRLIAIEKQLSLFESSINDKIDILDAIDKDTLKNLLRS